MELKGRIDEDGEFMLRTDRGESLCVLFVSSPEEADEFEEEFDLSGYAEGPVSVTCDSFDGADAWGVTAVETCAEAETEA